MDDKCIMEGLLLDAKSVCDLYMHGAIESSTQQVRQTFSAAFDDALSMGDSLYQQMTAKGWYQTDTAPEQKVQQTRQKFNPTFYRRSLETSAFPVCFYYCCSASSFSTSLRRALPRWLMRFFSSALIWAVRRPSSGRMKSGS